MEPRFIPVGEPGSPLMGPPTSLANDSLGGIAGTVLYLLELVVPIIMTLALIYFFYGLAKYILIMIYGIIALFVMGSVWGLTAVLNNTFLNGGSTAAPRVDQILIR